MKVTTVFIDFETGGLKPDDPDIQVAAIAVDPDWSEIDTFEEKIQFDPARADKEALAINHYDPAVWVEHAKPEGVVVARLQRFLRKFSDLKKISKRGKPYNVARIAGHNVAKFDADRLVALFKRHGQFCPAECYRALDTVQLALWHYARDGAAKPPPDYKLTTLARHLNAECYIDDAHDALADCRLSIAVARAIFQRTGGQG